MICPHCGELVHKKQSSSTGEKHIYKTKDNRFRIRVKSQEYYTNTLEDAISLRDTILEKLERDKNKPVVKKAKISNCKQKYIYRKKTGQYRVKYKGVEFYTHDFAKAIKKRNELMLN